MRYWLEEAIGDIETQEDLDVVMDKSLMHSTRNLDALLIRKPKFCNIYIC